MVTPRSRTSCHLLPRVLTEGLLCCNELALQSAAPRGSRLIGLSTSQMSWQHIPHSKAISPGMTLLHREYSKAACPMPPHFSFMLSVERASSTLVISSQPSCLASAVSFRASSWELSWLRGCHLSPGVKDAPPVNAGKLEREPVAGQTGHFHLEELCTHSREDTPKTTPRLRHCKGTLSDHPQGSASSGFAEMTYTKVKTFWRFKKMKCRNENWNKLPRIQLNQPMHITGNSQHGKWQAINHTINWQLGSHTHTTVICEQGHQPVAGPGLNATQQLLHCLSSGKARARTHLRGADKSVWPADFEPSWQNWVHQTVSHWRARTCLVIFVFPGLAQCMTQCCSLTK